MAEPKNWFSRISLDTARQLFTYARMEAQRKLDKTVLKHLQSIVFIFIVLLSVTLIEFYTWKKSLRKNYDKEAYFTLYHQLFATFDREDVYHAGFIFFVLMVSTAALLPSPLYAAIVFFSLAKCLIKIIPPLLDLINILFVYQHAMILQYTEYTELLANGTTSVDEYDFIKPPVGLCISLLICLLRISLSLYIIIHKFKSNDNTASYKLISIDIAFETMLVVLPYTSKNIFSITRRSIIRILIIKIKWTLTDSWVQCWLLIKFTEYGMSILMSDKGFLNFTRWFFRAVQTVRHVPNSVTVWYILACRFVSTCIIILFMFCCIEEPSPDIIQFKLSTFKAKLVYDITTPDTLLLTLTIVLFGIYLMDTIVYFKKADEHGKFAFIWFLTGKDLRPLLDKLKRIYNRLRMGNNWRTPTEDDVARELENE